MEKQKSIFALALVMTFMTTIFFLPGLTAAGNMQAEGENAQIMNQARETSECENKCEGECEGECTQDRYRAGQIDDDDCECEGATVAATGQTVSFAARDDGDLQMGVALPDPRFTDNGNLTVTDNLTGLIWMKNANLFVEKNIWTVAVDSCNCLADDGQNLIDGSVAGDWRLPNVRELQSLIDYGAFMPALSSDHPFKNVQTWTYWSSTSTGSLGAWTVYLGIGTSDIQFKTDPAGSYVWCARGGK